MNAAIYPSVNEAQVIWACKLIAGRKEDVRYEVAGKRSLREVLPRLLVTVSSFLFY
jgi:hypothetical protein